MRSLVFMGCGALPTHPTMVVRIIYLPKYRLSNQIWLTYLLER